MDHDLIIDPDHHDLIIDPDQHVKKLKRTEETTPKYSANHTRFVRKCMLRTTMEMSPKLPLSQGKPKGQLHHWQD